MTQVCCIMWLIIKTLFSENKINKNRTFNATLTNGSGIKGGIKVGASPLSRNIGK